MSTRSRPGPPGGRRWPVALAFVLVFLLAGSLIAALVNFRQVAGAVPGAQAILGLAASSEGFLAGTADGAYFSPDGRQWVRISGFVGETVVAGDGAGGALALYRDEVFEASDLRSFTKRGSVPDGTVAPAVGPAGEIYLAIADGRFYRFGESSPVEFATEGAPEELIALAVSLTEPMVLLAGGLSSGLWRFTEGEGRWTRLLGTPTRAVLVDEGTPGRSFIATAGGVLGSRDGRVWEFTELREPVEALAQSAGTIFAITSSRLLYESVDGTVWKARALQD
ncbi:MAG: hypothetical protein ACT4OM_05210 [Actinomycetota bacterium]